MPRRYVVCLVILLMFVGYVSAQSRRLQPRITLNQRRELPVTRQLVEQMIRDNAVDRECVESARDRFGDLFSASAMHLNRDARPELYVIGSGCVCQGARRCFQWLYRQTRNGYEQILDAVAADDIVPLRTSANGYSDLRVTIPVGDRQVASVYRFDGTRYVEDYSGSSSVVPRGPAASSNNQTALPRESRQPSNALYTPERNSVERRAIMDALRTNVRNVRGLRGSIIFTIRTLNVQNGWAFIVASPQSSDGRPLREFQESCEFDQDVIALLRRRGNRWQVVERDVCPSDVSYGDWGRRYGAPRAIFGLN